MNINSENIQKKEFHIVFKGYKPEEVDKFLDLLSIEFDKLKKKVDELEENMDSIKYEGDKESVKMKRVIQEALVSAHKVAEEIKQKAKTEAEELVNNRRLEEEQAISKIRAEKEMLQQNIARLKEDYSSFKDQISKFADDFKKKTLNIGDIQLDDTLKKIDIASEKINMNEISDIGGKEEEEKSETIQDSVLPEDDGTTNSLMNDQEEYKHAKKELIEESGMQEDNSAQSQTLSDDIIEKLNNQGIGGLEEDKEKVWEESDSPDIQKEKVVSEDNDEAGEKKTRKKIDIANPDIINDFFKTDED
ncbi:MAG: DivIVA domain-containing protein [Candidatus Humimicrobiaceae bacterium]